MRIIGYLEHPEMKITVFKTDTRLSVKFEKGLLEQTFKFLPDNGLEGLEGTRRLVDQDFLDGVEQQFRLMEALHVTSLARHFPNLAGDEFDEII